MTFEVSSSLQNHTLLLFLGTEEDDPFLPFLKNYVGGAKVFLLTTPIQTITEVVIYCKTRGITGIITTSIPLLSKLLFKEGARKQPSLDNYAGSLFKYDNLEIVFINPLIQLKTVSYGSFITARNISKLTQKSEWPQVTKFNWCIGQENNLEEIFTKFKSAFLIAVDSETFKTNASIRCVGYTAVFIYNNDITTYSVVIPCTSDYLLSWIRKFNWELQAPKILQNGKYDCSYFSRFNAPLYNYLFDTINLFHSWYSELPKDLASINSFAVRESMYWKDLAETTDLHEYYKYNALDTWVTVNAAIYLINNMPEWAKKNYLMEFPKIFPCHLAEMIGVKRDFTKLEEQRSAVNGNISTKTASLRKMLGSPDFNTNSAPQVKKLMHILGCKDIDSSNEKDIKKAILRHPLNSRILNLILDIRGDRKLISTYLRTDADKEQGKDNGSKEFNGTILFTLNPHGTDTGRLASTEHHFWCGLQFHNIPRGKVVKSTVRAYPGFRFCECDLKQAETRDSAYISGDTNLIAAVNSTKDFHSLNASAFFGIAYDKIFSDKTGKVLDKVLRDLSKRTNHGATYCMGAEVLVNTMGEDKVYAAGRILGLPKFWTPVQIAQVLLNIFHKTYPGLEKNYYPAVKNEVALTHKLVGATGWTRYCFKDPNKNKRAFNAYVAHGPQSLNAMVLNMAWEKVFYDIAINEKYIKDFKLICQIHDSILFQFREGHEYLCEMVKEKMEIPVTIKSCDGVTRTFTVPADIKAGEDDKGSIYWSDIE